MDNSKISNEVIENSQLIMEEVSSKIDKNPGNKKLKKIKLDEILKNF